ncbi:MAG TPA: hypothetical protein VI434_09610 [Candidatus Dormibacteraeota bacterium]
MGPPAALPAWLWVLATALAAIVAAWDIWTNGSIYVAVIASVAAIYLAVGFERSQRQGHTAHTSRHQTDQDSRRTFSPMVILTGQAPALQFARVFLVGILLCRFGFAPDKPLFVDAILASMVAGVTVLMFALLMPSINNREE